MLFIKKFDYLSPRITFYYKEVISHSSILSGILSIIFFSIKIILGIYYSLDLIQRKDLKAFYYNTFIEDAPTFPLNSSSLFHFLTLENRDKDKVTKGIDFTQFRIIGFEIYFENFVNNPFLFQIRSHWIYGNCNSDDIKGINYLINNDFSEESICIKKYYDPKENKYYDKGDPKFKWPVIAHGTNNPNNQYYSLYMGKCHEDTINLFLGEGHHCKTDSEIEEYFKSSGTIILNFYFVDNYVTIKNYKNPFTKYLYKIDKQIHYNEYSINNINFHPATTKTHNGLLFDSVEQEASYVFDRNDVYVSESKENNIYCAFSLWLKNTNMYYERTYKRIQDIFSLIGGFNHIINILGILINKLYSKYIVLCDTEQLLLSLIN